MSERILDAGSQPLAKDLPPELWMRVASNMLEEDILQLSALNRTFLGLALDIKYRSVDVRMPFRFNLGIFAPFSPILQHIWDSPLDIAPHVRRLVMYDYDPYRRLKFANKKSFIGSTIADSTLWFMHYVMFATPVMAVSKIYIWYLISRGLVKLGCPEGMASIVNYYTCGFVAYQMVPHWYSLYNSRQFLHYKSKSFFTKLSSVRTLDIRAPYPHNEPSDVSAAILLHTLRTTCSGFRHSLTEMHLPIVNSVILYELLLEEPIVEFPLESLYIYDSGTPIRVDIDLRRRKQFIPKLAAWINMFANTLRKLHVMIVEWHAQELFDTLATFTSLNTLEVIFPRSEKYLETITPLLTFIKRHEATLEKLYVPSAAYPLPYVSSDRPRLVFPEKKLQSFGFSCEQARNVLKAPSAEQLRAYAECYPPEWFVVEAPNRTIEFLGFITTTLDNRWFEGFRITRLHLSYSDELWIGARFLFDISQFRALRSLKIDLRFVGQGDGDLDYPSHDAVDTLSSKIRAVIGNLKFTSHPLRELDIRRLPPPQFHELWNVNYPCNCSPAHIWGLMKLFLQCFPSITHLGGVRWEDAPSNGRIRVCSRCKELARTPSYRRGKRYEL